MSDLVTITRVSTIEEAIVIESALRAGGFYASIPDLHYAVMYFVVVPALGGIRILVREDELEEAIAYLLTLESSAVEIEEETEALDGEFRKRQPRWFSFGLAWFAGWLFMPFILAFYGLKALRGALRRQI
ncbi:hypothetical protein [Euryhalocaulis caribicus]|uniref:hypothetical protein n=1 Tax=Euryhalocaulis caribicus TaxID=1161401 RepID=UPI0003A64273|nr:hypothetical protein [Euryhalocaulis caribicus]